jgi:hypothetical protein
MNILPKLETTLILSPNERTFITGFFGLLLTSTTGAKLQFIPSSLSFFPMVSPFMNASSIVLISELFFNFSLSKANLSTLPPS